MSIICSSRNLSSLESLLHDLQAHCYALNLLVGDDDPEWSDPRLYLLSERVDFLCQTADSLHSLQTALRQGYDFEPAIHVTPEAASDTPSA